MTTTPDDVPELHIGAVSIDCADPGELADFYGELLGTRRIVETPDGRIVAVSDGTHTLAMMKIDDYVAPTWPDDGQRQQMHFDISVKDLDRASARAAPTRSRPVAGVPRPRRASVLPDDLRFVTSTTGVVRAKSLCWRLPAARRPDTGTTTEERTWLLKPTQRRRLPPRSPPRDTSV